MSPRQHQKSDLYRDLLPLINSGTVELLDVPRLAVQLIGLERRTARGGRDSIDHAPGAHDDLANAVAGMLVALNKPRGYDTTLSWVGGPCATSNRDWHAARLWNHLNQRRM